jgi:hypothetical protein
VHWQSLITIRLNHMIRLELTSVRLSSIGSGVTKTKVQVLTRSHDRLSVETIPFLVRFPPNELAAVDRWIADQPSPMPTRGQAVRTLTQLGLRARRSRPSRPQPPARPWGLAAPGLIWELSSGRWVAIWQAHPRFVKRGYPDKRAQLWAGVDSGSKPTSSEWITISARCLKFQRELRTWRPKPIR